MTACFLKHLPTKGLDNFSVSIVQTLSKLYTQIERPHLFSKQKGIVLIIKYFKIHVAMILVI